jgi:hypothetical protein
MNRQDKEKMRKIQLLLVMAVIALTACSKSEKPAAAPPAFTETVYALAAEAPHIAVLNLADNRLTRLALDRPAADMTLADGRIFILSRKGELARMDGGKAGKWTRVTDRGVSLAAAGHGNLAVLGKSDIAIVRPDGRVLRRAALHRPADAIAFDRQANLLWLTDSASGAALAVDAEELADRKTIEVAGNSPHRARRFPGRPELWVAEGNEYMNGKPYGVGYARNAAMPGGINVIDTASGKMTDFIMVGGNVDDLWIAPGGGRVFAAVSQYDAYTEATVSVVDPEQRRVRAEFRLCRYCHEGRNVEPESGRALVRALVVAPGKAKETKR